MTTSQEKIKSLFEDLGKPTLRGVRKCPKCGIYNGTRGLSCKNKQCDVVFKEKEKKKGHSVEAVKIITGSTVQVFSVRLRDRGPDYRGFVQLPLVQDLDGNPASVIDPAVLASAARCYVESCSRSAQIGTHETACSHIKAAIDCTSGAKPLTLKNSVLNSLQVSNEIKQEIWLLATATTGPLVQRVTKNIMVVKCKPVPKQPLGFLHFSFFDTSRNRSLPASHKFQCSCKSNRGPKAVQPEDKRCVHFYACVCAFASDEKLLEEFSNYIDLETTPNPNNSLSSSLSDEAPVSPEQQLVTIYQTSVDGELTEVQTDGDQSTLEVVVAEEFLETPAKKRRKEEIAQASSALLTLQESNTKPVRITTPGKSGSHRSLPTPRKPANPNQPIEETEVLQSFHSWLASVTERINQTMHYQFDGNPDPLVFHAPQFFFDCLQQRISSGNKKKRLPNFTTAFVRKDALPLGTFTKYTWHITNIIHVKQIFDTPEMVNSIYEDERALIELFHLGLYCLLAQHMSCLGRIRVKGNVAMPLEITRNFVENRDSTYDLYDVPKMDLDLDRNQTPIRPFELKTYLKVGNTSQEQKEPTPFIIEWIPDILPRSHIGELRIKFEYGHQRNGHIEQRGAVMTSPINLPHPLQPNLGAVASNIHISMAAT